MLFSSPRYVLVQQSSGAFEKTEVHHLLFERESKNNPQSEHIVQACNPSTWEAEAQEFYFEGKPEQLNEETPEFQRGLRSGVGW